VRIAAGCAPYIDRGVLLIEYDVCIVSKVATAAEHVLAARTMRAIDAGGAE